MTECCMGEKIMYMHKHTCIYVCIYTDVYIYGKRSIDLIMVEGGEKVYVYVRLDIIPYWGGALEA